MKKGFAILSILVLAVLAIGIVTSVYLIKNPTLFKPRASERVATLSEIKLKSGITFFGYGLPEKPTIYPETNLKITSPLENVYEIRAYQFPCPPGTKHPDGTACDPDRFEIRLPAVEKHIFGLGMQPAANQAEVADFLDTSFSFGHCALNRGDGVKLDYYVEGGCRLRTPILVIPEKNLLIAYLQPEVKILRLTRDNSFSCPAGNTCIVMKKHHLYPEGSPAPLIIIKADSLDQVYSAFYQYLKTVANRPFKDPNYRAFGVNWETFGEFGCVANKQNILDTVNRFKNVGVSLSTVTIGSGYWQAPGTSSAPAVGCAADAKESGLPATDSLQVNDQRYGGLSGLNDLFSTLNSQNIYPLIGMRFRIQPGNASYENVNRVWDFFKTKGLNENYLVSQNPSDISTRIPAYTSFESYFVDGKKYFQKHFPFNVFNPKVTDTWIDLTRQYYGNFKGIKHDDMTISDQRGFYNYLQKIGQAETVQIPRANLRDDFSPTALSRYPQKYANDFLIFTNNDWFSQTGDGEEIDSYQTPGPTSYQGDLIKLYFDNAIGRSMSGYFLSMNYIGQSFHLPGDFTTEAGVKKYLRQLQQATFYPVSTYSKGYWHLKTSSGTDNVPAQGVATYFLKLKNRLQQYAYDQAKRTFETGSPYTIRPLMFDYPNDPEVYKQYTYLSAATDAADPKDEYLFGNALLVRPVFSDTNSALTYFPSGNWKALISQSTTRGKIFTQGYTPYPIPLYTALGGDNLDYPVFLKEGEILIISDSSNTNLLAYVFLGARQNSSVYYHYPKTGGRISLQVIVENAKTFLVNLNSGKRVEMQNDAFGKGFKIGDVKSIL